MRACTVYFLTCMRSRTNRRLNNGGTLKLAALFVSPSRWEGKEYIVPRSLSSKHIVTEKPFSGPLIEYCITKGKIIYRLTSLISLIVHWNIVNRTVVGP